MHEIRIFRGEFFFLSNFFPDHAEFDGLILPSWEHVYQLQKIADCRNRQVMAERVSKMTPGQCKRLSKSFPYRVDWDAIKIPLMRQLIAKKFSPEKALAQQLRNTFPARLIHENNHKDTFWGVCDGKGHNHLGRILMDHRDTL